MNATEGDLREALQSILGPSIHVVKIDRRPSPYCTSSPIEELQVHCQHGAPLAIIWKDLSRSSLSETARQAKPAFLDDPLREIEVYESLLPAARLGTPHYYGKVVDESLGRYWLFLEHVIGRELYQVGDFQIWREAAAWLAGLHARHGVNPAQVRAASRVLNYGGAFYRLWIKRAIAFAFDDAAVAKLDWLAQRYDTIVERLLDLPMTFLHGEFYASNVLVAEGPGGRRICPVDWEMAARGPGLIDLAALTAGNWNDEQRADLSQTYRDAWQVHGVPGSALQDFGTALDCCRIHLAVQWLGWSPDWSPPPEHRHDWLGEALRLAERLSL